MQLTRREFETLAGFNDRWIYGEGDWIVEHLACRGMLERGITTVQREGVVFETANPGVLPKYISEIAAKKERAIKYHYRITRRGDKAKHHARIT